jgi:hypothetical protein
MSSYSYTCFRPVALFFWGGEGVGSEVWPVIGYNSGKKQSLTKKNSGTVPRIFLYEIISIHSDYLEGRMSGLIEMACPSLIKQGPSRVRIFLE